MEENLFHDVIGDFTDLYSYYGTDSQLHLGDELSDFDIYWYDDDIWDTSNIVTIDNRYKTINYQIKCMRNEDFCACQSYNHGPIYECQQTINEPNIKGASSVT